MEEALYEIASLRTLAGLGLEAIPDETTILSFCHRLEASDLAEDIFKQVNAHLARSPLPGPQGTISPRSRAGALRAARSLSCLTRRHRRLG
jgi:transposase, IS5 family